MNDDECKFLIEATKSLIDISASLASLVYKVIFSIFFN